MKKKPDKIEEIRDLLGQVIDGHTDPNTLKELGEKLQGDPEACEEYLDQMTLHAFLQRELGGDLPIDADLMEHARGPGTAKGLRKGFHTLLLYGKFAAAGFLLVVCLWLGFLLGHRESKPAPVAAPYVAQLKSANGALWKEPQPVLEEGDRIRQGDLVLTSGLLEIELFDGAVIVLEGPARLSLLSPNRVTLHSGMLAADVPERAIGFSVETPVGTVVDLGTRFGVRVDPTGTTETHVFAGEIDLSPHADESGHTHRLVENTAIRIDPLSRSTEPISSDASAYPRPTQSINRLSDGDFPLGTLVASSGIPTEEDQWSGDLAKVVGEELGIKPHSGKGMLKFLTTNLAVPGSDLSTAASQQWQIMDVRSLRADINAGRVTASATAYLNRVEGDEFTDIRLAVALHAFKGELSEAKDTWERRDELRLGRAEAEISTDSLPLTWEAADIRLPIPRGTDYLILEIRAVENVTNDIDVPEFDGHYADDVSLTLHVDLTPAHSSHQWVDVSPL